MDYKVISPAEYFGTTGQHAHQGNGGTLLMNPHVVHGTVRGGGEVGLNVLANGAVAAGQAQGFNPYGGSNDNYGYIVREGYLMIMRYKWSIFL